MEPALSQDLDVKSVFGAWTMYDGLMFGPSVVQC
jgi:hypothetical protein